jgi:hypothetical protein
VGEVRRDDPGVQRVRRDAGARKATREFVREEDVHQLGLRVDAEPLEAFVAREVVPRDAARAAVDFGRDGDDARRRRRLHAIEQQPRE